MAVISQDAEAELLEATFELHNMCLEIVEEIINDDNMLRLFHINEVLWTPIRKSWQNSHKDLMGRFDFAWDGKNPPKMLEYNADTPSLLLESTDVQHVWFEQKWKGKMEAHQSNYMSYALQYAFRDINEWCRDSKLDSIRHPRIMLMTYSDDDESYAHMLQLQFYLNMTY